jgi:hypothetical protein
MGESTVRTDCRIRGARDDTGEHRKEKQEHDQNGNGKSLKDERKFTEDSLAEDRKQYPLQSQDEGRGE